MRICQKDDQLCGGEPCRQCAKDAVQSATSEECTCHADNKAACLPECTFCQYRGGEA